MMLRVYRGWIITPVSATELVAQKGHDVFRGEYEDLIVKIDRYERAIKLLLEMEAEKGVNTKTDRANTESRD